MLSQLTIAKRSQLPLELDYQQLYAIGLKHVQRLSSRIWTDYNVHDPGITTLELLCYALTDLSYRASFPIEDLLASPTDNRQNMQQQFFTARQIFPNRALTQRDYRKLLIDLAGVKNAWVQSATQVYYADTLTGKLLGSPALFVEELIDLPSFAAKLKQSSPDPVSRYLWAQLSSSMQQSLTEYEGTDPQAEPLRTQLVQSLNRIIQGDVFYHAGWVSQFTLSAETQALMTQYQQAQAAKQSTEEIGDRLNRFLLEDVYQEEIATNLVLRESVALRGVKKINLAGLYEVLIDYMDDITESADKATVIQAVKQRLNANRNLCEDFVSFQEVETQLFLLCAELELAPDADVSQVKAEILFQVQQYLAPPVNNYTLSEMLTRRKPDGTVYTADEIFEGSILDCGFIDDAELDQAELRREIRLSDVISIIMDIAGVRAVRDILINPQATTVPLDNKWLVSVEAGKKAILNRERSRLVFYKRNMPVVADDTQVAQAYASLTDAVKTKAETPVAYDLEIPLGTDRQSDRYYSFQNHFPAVYGLSEVGVSGAADDRRQALAYQLKAYLLFFDQIMANYFAQLSQVKQLFSTDPTIHHTYFFQVVNSFAEYQKIYRTDDVTAILQAQNDEREQADHLKRRHHFLDHLIARFAEQFHEFVSIMYSAFQFNAENMVSDKCRFLQQYPSLSSERAIAYNYSLQTDSDLWNSTNISGLEKRLTSLLGIRNNTRRNLGEMTFDIYAEVDATSDGNFEFRLRNGDTLDLLFSSTTIYATEELARQVLEQAIQAASLPSGYQHEVTTEGQYRFNIVDETGTAIARSSQDFDAETQLNQAIDAVIEYVRVNYSDEGMYLIENMLLRPEHPDDPFLPICPNPNCTDCADLDPYSYRLHIILPASASRFRNMDFRRFAEALIRAETPAHILPKICWISKDAMMALEKRYRNWLYLKAGMGSGDRAEILRLFIFGDEGEEDKGLFTVRNVYPSQNLYECDSGEDQPKFILGRTALGSGEDLQS
jgi:hypothetical protein